MKGVAAKLNYSTAMRTSVTSRTISVMSAAPSKYVLLMAFLASPTIDIYKNLTRNI